MKLVNEKKSWATHCTALFSCLSYFVHFTLPEGASSLKQNTPLLFHFLSFCSRHLLAHHCSEGIIENIFQALACEGRAFQVFYRFDFVTQFLAFVGGDGLLFVLLQLFQSLLVFPKIDLRSNQDDGGLWTMMA